jgi:hypothetical protein
VAVGGGRRRQRLVAVGEVAAGHAGHPRVGRHVARGRRSLHAHCAVGGRRWAQAQWQWIHRVARPLTATAVGFITDYS